MGIGSINKKIALISISIIVVYFYFSVKIHMYESYLYALSAKKIIDIKEAFFFLNPWLEKLSNFEDYHPNHPLLTLISNFISNKYRTDILHTSSLINTISALISSFVFFKILELYNENFIKNAIASTMPLFFSIYWYNSHSGEAYTSGGLFILIAFYILLKTQSKNIIIASLLFGFSVSTAICFHSLYFFPSLLLLPIFIYFFDIGPKEKLFFILSSITIIGSICTFFYIIPVYCKIGAESFEQVLQIFSFYKEEMGIWSKSNTNNLGFLLFPLYSGLFHIAQSTIDGPQFFLYPLRAMFILLLIYSLVKTLRGSFNKFTAFFIFYFLFFFIFTSYILYLPYDITYWGFVSFPISFILCSSINTRMLFMTFFIILITTFINTILPQHYANASQHFGSTKLLEIAASTYKTDALVFNIYDSTSTTSYQNYLGLIWETRSKLNIKSYFIIDQRKYENKMNFITKNHSNFLLIENVTNVDKLSNEKYEINERLKINLKHLFTLKTEYNPALDRTSEMEHEQVWYDQGPMFKHWNYYIYTATNNTF